MVGDVAELLTALQGATPTMLIGIALCLAGFFVYAGLKIINLLGNHLIHAIGAATAELEKLNAHEVVEAAELRKQTDSLLEIKMAVGTADVAARSKS